MHQMCITDISLVKCYFLMKFVNSFYEGHPNHFQWFCLCGGGNGRVYLYAMCMIMSVGNIGSHHNYSCIKVIWACAHTSRHPYNALIILHLMCSRVSLHWRSHSEFKMCHYLCWLYFVLYMFDCSCSFASFYMVHIYKSMTFFMIFTSDLTPRLSNTFLNWNNVPFSPDDVPLWSRL